MVTTQRKTKKPPAFPYHPKNRAKQLKKSWIENQKIKSKWKAQKRREGLTNHPASAVEEPDQAHVEAKIDSDSDGSQSRHDPPPTQQSAPTSPSHDKNSLHDLRKLAYSSRSPRTRKADPVPRKASGISQNDRGGKARDASRRGRDKGQPNMKLRMNVLLEKIKHGSQ